MARPRADFVLGTVEDHEIGLDSRQPNLTDKAPAIVLIGWSGGARCCITVHVYRTDPFSQVLYSGPYGTGPEILGPIAGEQHSALLFEESLYGGFFDDLHPSTMPSSPLVACFSGDRFRDCTQRYPFVIDKCEITYSEGLARVLQHKWPWGDTGPAVVDLWGGQDHVDQADLRELRKNLARFLHGT